MYIYHFIWFLLPLLYLAIILKAYVKRMAKSYLLEDEKDYIRHLIFCVVCLVIAILIDNRFGEDLEYGFLSELGDAAVFRWLIYPAVLLAVASISGFIPFLKSKETPKAPRSKF